ncbi:hypothetical protein [uncultured Clostridium sp.]|uniref:hypothetical protein n=1 Tax=uncultured Clostridium sp. TaxID=59620 RepID=UPI00261427FC|nr:hypothetical protein [uncultured Clostridium sp.]
MKCEVIDIRGNKREKLGKFLIALYALNIVELIFTKILLWRAPDLFNDTHKFLRPLLYGLESYFFKIGIAALLLIFWYWRSENANITQIKRSILIGQILIGAYILMNIGHLVNLIIFLK